MHQNSRSDSNPLDYYHLVVARTRRKGEAEEAAEVAEEDFADAKQLDTLAVRMRKLLSAEAHRIHGEEGQMGCNWDSSPEEASWLSLHSPIRPTLHQTLRLTRGHVEDADQRFDSRFLNALLCQLRKQNQQAQMSGLEISWISSHRRSYAYCFF